MVTVTLIGLLSFAALAIDLGLMVVARTQCQAAADAAALAGCRTINGSQGNNVPAAIAMAQSVATSNTVLNNSITPAQVANVQAGIYQYNTSTNSFQAIFGQTPGANQNYGLLQVQIVTQQPSFFANIMGVQSMTVGAVATAVHRPRDIAIVLDFSQSMGYATMFKYPAFGTVTGLLNPDPAFPQFGPWSIFGGPGMVLDPNNPGTPPGSYATYVPPTPFQRVFTLTDNSGEYYGPNNITMATQDGPAVVNNFLLSDNQTNAFTSSWSSFPSFPNINLGTSGYPTGIITPTPSTFVNQNASGFVGDPFPLAAGVTVTGAPTPNQYAQTVADYIGIARSSVTDTTYNSNFETNGYDWNFATNSLKPAIQKFQGFTVGPGYYGKTFYMWPPDPRTPIGNIGSSNYVAGDWRQRFFTAPPNSGYDTRDNSLYYGINGQWAPQGLGQGPFYFVNYNAVLAWLTSGPITLPPSLRSGRVVYYNSIPTSIPTDPNTGLTLSSATADQIFWRDYIDYVLGTGQYTPSTVLAGANSKNGNSRTGTALYYNNPSNTNLPAKIVFRAALTSASTGGPVPYMRYDETPIHPVMQFWFGPMSMLGYLQQQFNSMPGTSNEAPCWQLKVGINAALNDMQSNHPNDQASLIYFSSSPGYATARVNLTNNYSLMQNALFFPYPILGNLGDPTATINPFLSIAPSYSNPAGIQPNNDTIIPNAGTQTCPQSGFMVAYNQLGSASGGGQTYTGRNGALKIVIFETDGVANCSASASLVQGGGGYYYNTPGNISYYGDSTELHTPPKDGAIAVVQQIVAPNTANPPGYSTPRNNALVHALAFGEIFEPAMASPMQTAAFQFLAAVQIYGNTSPKPVGNWDSDSLNYMADYVNYEPYKIITGTATQRISEMQTALQRIMQAGVQVALIQ
jgi:hypothetical protein